MLKKNKKGFTLVELLATIVILGLLSTVTITSFASYYTRSKEKANETFKKQLIGYIEDYIALYGSSLGYSNGELKQKCHTEYDSSIEENINVCDTVTLYKAGTNPMIESIASELTNKDIINPSTEIKCTNSNIIINIYRDTDFVYCMNVIPTGESCIDEEINTCSNIFK